MNPATRATVVGIEVGPIDAGRPLDESQLVDSGEGLDELAMAVEPLSV
jgi:hypothetical protein